MSHDPNEPDPCNGITLATLKAGDAYTVKHHSHPEPWSGVAHEADGYVYAGPCWVHECKPDVGPGDRTGVLTLLAASRPAPTLPTEPGSVILATEVRGVRLDPAVAITARDDEGWTAARQIAGWYWHAAEHITEWTLARVVPADEVAR